MGKKMGCDWRTESRKARREKGKWSVSRKISIKENDGKDETERKDMADKVSKVVGDKRREGKEGTSQGKMVTRRRQREKEDKREKEGREGVFAGKGGKEEERARE